ncbi:MAG: CDC27 family protein, partial [Myxococcota bacterium]
MGEPAEVDPRERAAALVDEAVFTLTGTPENAGWVSLLRLVRSALSSERPDPAAVLRMAHALEETGRYTLATDFFREAIRSEPESPVAWTHFAEVCRRLGRWEEAIGAYDEALRVAPSYPWAVAG